MGSNLEEILSFSPSFKETKPFLELSEFYPSLVNFDFDFNLLENSTIPKVVNPSTISIISSSTPLPSILSKKIGRPKGSKNKF